MATNDSFIQDSEIILWATVSVIYIIILLPICIYILYLGFKQWESKKNDPSWFISYTDFFTYNLVVMELVAVAAYVALATIFRFEEKSGALVVVGSFGWYGEMMFPTYTCIEHYFAAVHPLTFLGLKKGKGRLIRNISTGLVWVITLVLISTACIRGFDLPFFSANACQMIVYLSVIFYCSVAVLKVLIHPKPGGAITDKRKLQKSKRHAFFVIALVLVVLSLKLCVNAILNIFWGVNEVDIAQFMGVVLVTYCNNLFGSLTLPLLYLQRAGKLQQCMTKFGIRK